jgi:hypothetical protein
MRPTANHDRTTVRGGAQVHPRAESPVGGASRSHNVCRPELRLSLSVARDVRTDNAVTNGDRLRPRACSDRVLARCRQPIETGSRRSPNRTVSGCRASESDPSREWRGPLRLAGLPRCGSGRSDFHGRSGVSADRGRSNSGHRRRTNSPAIARPHGGSPVGTGSATLTTTPDRDASTFAGHPGDGHIRHRRTPVAPARSELPQRASSSPGCTDRSPVTFGRHPPLVGGARPRWLGGRVPHHAALRRYAAILVTWGTLVGLVPPAVTR